MNVDYLETPMGIIKIIENQDTIVEISFAKEIPSDFSKCDDSLLIKTKNQLKEYFDGSRKTFDFLLSIKGTEKGTEFQKKVWNTLQEIPYGETRSYKEIAEQIGSPNAARAVGLANNKNPLLLVIPCHRIVGSAGDLVGYVAGVDAKKEIVGNRKDVEPNVPEVNKSIETVINLSKIVGKQRMAWRYDPILIGTLKETDRVEPGLQKTFLK